MEQKIKQNDRIGENIRKIRKAKGLGQTDLVRMLQIDGCDMTRECLVKIERCTQHIQATQLQAIKKALKTSYEALIDGVSETNAYCPLRIFSRRGRFIQHYYALVILFI